MAAQQSTEAAAQSLRKHFGAISRTDVFEMKSTLNLHVTTPLVAFMGIPDTISAPVKFLDLACGSGLVTEALQACLPREILDKSSFTASDVSPNLVEIVAERAARERWKNVETLVLDAQDTRLPSNSFTHAAVALGLQIIPDPDAVVKDCIRVLEPGGLFAASTWAEKNKEMWWLPDIRSAFDALPFDAPMSIGMQMHDSGRWYDASWVDGHLRDLGLEDVDVREHEGIYHLAGVDEFMYCFGGVLPFLAKTCWTEETAKAHPVEEVKPLVVKHLYEKYGGKGWDIRWTSLLMTGRVPETKA